MRARGGRQGHGDHGGDAMGPGHGGRGGEGRSARRRQALLVAASSCSRTSRGEPLHPHRVHDRRRGAAWAGHAEAKGPRAPARSARAGLRAGGGVRLVGRRGLDERGSRQSSSVDERAEEQSAVGRAEQRVDRVLGVGHQAEHVPCLVADPGHVGDRAVRVLAGRVAEEDLPVRLELLEQLRVGEPAALAVLDRDRERLPRVATAPSTVCPSARPSARRRGT